MENKKELLNAYLKKIDQVIANGIYKDTWESLAFYKVADWYKNAKFGIFIHWGPYCVPAYGSEWYSHDMYKKNKPEFAHHEKTYGKHKDFGYKDFIPMFKAEKFDAAEWAELFKNSGAKFVMPVAEHTDGFPMYDCSLTDWCSSKMGPNKDIVGLLKPEIEKREMVFTASSHRAEHYWFMCGMREQESDMPEPLDYGHIYWPSFKEPFSHEDALWEVSGFELDELFMQDWLVRTCEIVDKYRPKIVYFDWWIHVESMKPYIRKFAAYYYNRALEWGEEVAINYKNDSFMFQSAVKDLERGQMSDICPYFWQCDTAVANNSWGYTENNDYKQSHEIICDLVDIVSKNGSLLLNVGPKADGTIPEEDKKILLDIGEWLKVNGEGIYGTYFWKKSGEGNTKTTEGSFSDHTRGAYTEEDFRFTFKVGAIYAFAMKPAKDGVYRIKTFAQTSKTFEGIIKNIEVLGSSTACKYIRCDDYLTVITEPTNSVSPICIKLTVE